ncbi:DUF3169 family protein [Halalkalibacter sp. APA_J-10(15)]|uniref:DUF3169 family protein n=1 Tax=unclassified Halalkalibacter TaxID=2893063 RepID=UPI001FF2F5FD|nr:DUF3169 family protein [Halalkalibacter sp. APA_J-10(15)]MCK0471005.1 DUF3169 family protein [Halalkalibacter sp. APA_J-10(15)]
MKALARTLQQFAIGGVLGFLGAMIILGNFAIDLSQYTNEIVIFLFASIVVFLIATTISFRQVKKLNAMDFEGEEEDKVDVLKYRKGADQSILIYTSTIIAILTLSIGIIMSLHIAYTIISIVLIIVSYSFTAYMMHLMRVSYPERNLPKLSDPDYTEKLLAASDDGERHVMLNGLYKAYHLLPVALIIAIIFSVLYSILTEHNQLFSVIAMSIVLIIVQGKYFLAIRNK